MKRLLPCLFAALASSGPVCAATFDVTRTDDPAPNGCAQNDCSLREAVIDANLTVQADVIMLPAGTYLIDFAGGVDNSEQTGALKISSDMEFVGAPSTVDGQHLGRIMDITGSADVTLRDLTLQNGNSTLATNNATAGGAIEADGDSLRVSNVTFLGNNTQGLGGAIRAFGDSLLEIDGCQFMDNHANNGAAIHASIGITVRNTVFQNNHADGGALGSGPVAYLTGGTSDSLLEWVRFEGNSSNGNGGGVYFGGRGLIVDVLVATDNEAVGGTGGVFFVFGATAKVVSITNARFHGNMAESGGVIGTSNDNDTITIEHSGFVNNQATAGSGGALYMTGGMVNVINDTFSGNQASSNGGAVYQFGGDLQIRHATLSDGTAAAGDAIYVLGNASVSVIELANNVIDGSCQVADSLSVTSLGGNVESPGDSCDLDAGSDLVGQTSMQLGLQPLRINYNATATHELLSGSVARGQAEPAICMDVGVDQLFLDRDLCNAGAVESEQIFKDSLETSDFEIL
jgi:predicted outer membrane repeat protein